MPQQSSSPISLTVFIYPSPGLSWDSPSKLFLSTLKNKVFFRPRPLGHVSIALGSPDKLEAVVHAGMTQKSKIEGVKEVLWDGLGFGILNHTFQGHLESAPKLVPEIKKRAQRHDQLSYLEFQISTVQEERIRKFLEEYQRREAHRCYGMLPDPLAFEGAGCTAFAAAVMTVAGFDLRALKDLWTRQFALDNQWVGVPGKNRVEAYKLLSAQSWAEASALTTEVFFWDPDLMHQWVLKSRDFSPEISTQFYGKRLEVNSTQWHKARGLLIDLRPFEKESERMIQAVFSERGLRLKEL